MSAAATEQQGFNSQLKKYYTLLHRRLHRLPDRRSRSPSRWACRAQWIGYWFLFATIGLYAGIGIMSRTAEVAEYYVAGPARAGVLQRHGDRRRLDERGLVHRHGRHALPRAASTGSPS